MSIPDLRPAANGRFYAYWSEGRRSKSKSMGTSDPDIARQRYAQWLLLGGPSATAEGEVAYTVADCWLVYAAKHIARNVTAPEALEYNWRALEPFFGPLTVPEVTQEAADLYLLRRTTGKLGRKVKPATVRKELSALVACLNFCARAPQRMFPAAAVEKIQLPDDGAPRDRWLTHDEIQRLLGAAARLRRGDRLSRGERFLWLALETGARQQALLDLTWDRVDFETRVIHYDVPGRRVTKKRRTSVPISKALLPILERAHAERQNNHVLDNGARLWSAVQLIAIEAGFGGKRPKALRLERPKATGISPHVLRHTAATHMARRGVPLWIIAKVLGNSLVMVEKVYAKHAPDDLRAAVDSISAGVLEAAE